MKKGENIMKKNYWISKEERVQIKNNIYQINISLSSYCIDEIQNIIKTIKSWHSNGKKTK